MRRIAPEHARLTETVVGEIPVPADELWVFGYGSLMWDPGFAHAEVHAARLHGHHRSLCVWSWRYRGTPAEPGLVFGLDRGGSCIGRAFRVPEAEKTSAVGYLREREMVGGVYAPLFKTVRLSDGRAVRSLTFVVRRDHPQYAGRLTAEQAAATVSYASGLSGPNADYITSTVQELDALGVRDPLLRRVCALIG